MFTITGTVQLLRDAEMVQASTSLTDEDKTSLLQAMLQSIPDGMIGLPLHASVVRASINRMIDVDRQRAGGKPTASQAQKQGRKTQGRKEPPEVDAGSPEEATEAPSGETSGSLETEDA